MQTKEEIKKEVVSKLDVFCKEHLEEVEKHTEGYLTDSYKMMSLTNLNAALELCFEETFNKIISRYEK